MQCMRQTQAATEPNGLVLYYQNLANGAKQREFFSNLLAITGAHKTTVSYWLHKNTVPASGKDRQLLSSLIGLTEIELFGDIPARRSGGRNRKAGGKVETA